MATRITYHGPGGYARGHAQGVDALHSNPNPNPNASRALTNTLTHALTLTKVWTRFTYASSFLDDAFLPRSGLPRAFLDKAPLPALKRVSARSAGGDGAAPDALDTLMMVLHSRLSQRAA